MRLLCLTFAIAGCGFSASGGSALSDGGTDTPTTDTPLVDAPPDAPPIDTPPGTIVRRISVAPRTETLTSFPVWVAISDPALAVESAGNVPYFATTDGNAIPFQIQRWDAGTGTINAWVLATIDATGAAFDLRAGVANGLPAQPAAVFAAPFVGVWHFDASATSLLADAHGTNNGTAVGAPAAATGKLGSGLSFDGTTDEVAITNPFAGDNSHTFSAWVSSTTTAGNGTIVTLGDPSADHARWFHTRFPALAAGFYNGNDFRPNDATVPAGFHLVHWVYDKGATRVSRLYIDGALVATSGALTATIATQTTAGHIGNAPGGFGASAFKGVLDEVRLVSQVRSAAWISAEYANQSAPASFYAVATVTL